MGRMCCVSVPIFDAYLTGLYAVLWKYLYCFHRNLEAKYQPGAANQMHLISGSSGISVKAEVLAVSWCGVFRRALTQSHNLYWRGLRLQGQTVNCNAQKLQRKPIFGATGLSLHIKNSHQLKKTNQLDIWVLKNLKWNIFHTRKQLFY